MSTGTLHRTSRLIQPGRRKGIEALFQTPVPPFQSVFPSPAGFSPDHEHYELHRAANRVYRARLEVYQTRGLELSAPELVDFVRKDVLAHLLDMEEQAVGPLKVSTYRFLNAKKFWAWLPAHRNRAEAMYGEFRAHFRTPKKRMA